MSNLDAMLPALLDPVPLDWAPTPLPVAAVLCPVVLHGGSDHLLFVLRTAHLRQHAGQVAFPGGKRDRNETPLATVLRECNEELGIPAAAITVLGSLPPRASSSGILVHCLVGRLQPLPLQPDPAEVARVLHLPLELLADDRRWQDRPPPSGASGAQPHASPHFEHDGELLWGLTARFVRDLCRRLPSTT